MLCEPAAAVPCVPYVPWDIAMSRSSRPVAARAVRVKSGCHTSQTQGGHFLRNIFEHAG